MKILDMKIGTLIYILKQTNLNESEKIELMNFVETASKEQIFHLLITGRMISESDIDQTIQESNNKHKEIVEQRLNELVLGAAGLATLIAYLAIVGAMAIIGMAIEVFMLTVSKQYRKCIKFKNVESEFELCAANVRLDAYEEKLKFLKDKISLCNKAKDPKECDLKVKLEINKTEKKIEAAKNEIKKAEEKVKSQKK